MARTRPVLSQQPFNCAWCGRPGLGYYPKRPAVRAKMPPFRFCRNEGRCQRRHWLARQREMRAQGMRPYACGGPGCPRDVPLRPGPGRLPLYCSRPCKTAAAKERRRQQPPARIQEARAAAERMAVKAFAAAQEADSHRDEFKVRIARHADFERIDEGRDPNRDALSLEDLSERINARDAVERQGKLDRTAARTKTSADDLAAALAQQEAQLARRAQTARIRRAKKKVVVAAAVEAADVEKQRLDPEYVSWLRGKSGVGSGG